MACEFLDAFTDLDESERILEDSSMAGSGLDLAVPAAHARVERIHRMQTEKPFISLTAEESANSKARPCSCFVGPTVEMFESHDKVEVRNIFCIGRNYVEHALELDNPVPKEEPVIFLKSSSALSPWSPSTASMAFSDEVFHHEIEVVLLVGEHVPLGSLSAGNETSCVQGVGLGLDLTRRGKQSELKQKGLPWTLAKSFAGAARVTPLAPIADAGDLRELSFELEVNGEVKQTGHCKQMIFNIPSQLRYLNSFLPLSPGDLIFTGTPAGVGPLRKGDSMRMRFLSPPSLAHMDFRTEL
jgi:2-keto-4-pentenoate hydratase/2-oxohepta-3-ene-1,7-dioic acid hydratase in catechol pathway